MEHSYSLGLIEVSALGHAISVADRMLKTAQVEFVATERRLGGRLVTLVVRGELSAVRASVDAGRDEAEKLGCLKAAEVIARPHPEILKFLHLDEEEKKPPAPQKEKEKPEEKAPKISSQAAKKTALDRKKPAKRAKKVKEK